MITKFSVLYSGHIDMENLGIEGTPTNDRRYPNERLIEAFDTCLEMAHIMEELGYHSLWLAEHHFQVEGYECTPNLLMLSTYLAQHTERIKFGCGFNIVPMWHPLRLAEDFATADILTNGRVIFGVGRGYHTREVESFGAPMLDADANRELFEEQVEIIFKAFNEDSFSHHGKHYTIPPRVPYRGYELEQITLVPRPVNRPVEVWQPIVTGSDRGIDFMVKNGIKGVISGTGEESADRSIHVYQDAAARSGQELQLGENIIQGFRWYVDETREKAIKAATPYFEENQKFSAPLGLGLALGTSFESLVERRDWLCGPPEELIGYLKEVESRYPGLEQILLSTAMGEPKAVVLEQLRLFAQEVMPAFRKPSSDGA